MPDVKPLTDAEIAGVEAMLQKYGECDGAWTDWGGAPRLLATIRALQAEKTAQVEALKVAREALVHARDNLTPHPDQTLDEALAKIEAIRQEPDHDR